LIADGFTAFCTASQNLQHSKRVLDVAASLLMMIRSCCCLGSAEQLYQSAYGISFYGR
jgi:hypothetical protein